MITRTRPLLVLMTVIALASTALAGCSRHDDDLHASATFDDVADLADGAPVMLSDITIGSVTSIRLDATGRWARVTFRVDRDAQVPADLEARVRRTTTLGEKFIDLVPRTTAPDAPLLRDGAVIARTRVVSDVEQLVSSGSTAFGALSGSEIAMVLDEGAQAVGGKGDQLAALLDDLSTIAHRYRDHTDDVKAIIADLNQLGDDLAPNVDANGEVLTNLNVTLDTLNANDQRFYDLVDSLNGVTGRAEEILDRHLAQIRRQVQGLKIVTGAVAREQTALGEVLTGLPRHNETTPQAERGGFVQVLVDLVVCGVPGGGDVPGDPVDGCYFDDAPGGD